MQSVSDIPVAQERTGRQADVGSVCTQKSSAQRGSPACSLPHQQHRLAGLQHAVEHIGMFLVLSIKTFKSVYMNYKPELFGTKRKLRTFQKKRF